MWVLVSMAVAQTQRQQQQQVSQRGRAGPREAQQLAVLVSWLASVCSAGASLCKPSGVSTLYDTVRGQVCVLHGAWCSSYSRQHPCYMGATGHGHTYK